MKINKKVYFLSVALLTIIPGAGNVWSSNISCIRCNSNPDNYCKHRDQGPEIVECFKKCSTNYNIGQGAIAKCFTSMQALSNPGPWNLASKRAFEAWYREIGGENGLGAWSPENREKALALMRDLPANSEPEPIVEPPKPEPKSKVDQGDDHGPKGSASSGDVPQPVLNPLMYLALNPSLLDGVKNKPLKQAMEELTHHYQTTGKNDGKAIHPDATHRIPGFHTAARPSGIPLTFNPIEYLALHADIVAYYGSQGMTLEEALEKAEVHYGSSGIKEQRAFSLGFTDEAKIPEQKQVEQKFDPLIYLALHPDIAAHYGKLPIHQALHEVTQHYASNGKGEGRAIVPTNTHPVPPLIPGSVSMGVIAVLPKNFNAAIYLVQHRDVFDYFSNEHRFGPSKTLNELLSDATAHYADNGRHEGRGHELTVGGEGQSGSGSNSNAGPGGSSSGSGGGDKQAEAPAFDPLLYLAMNRAVVAKFKDLPIKDALEQARVHYETEGKGQNLPTRPKPGGSAGFYMSEMGPPMQFGPGFNPLIYLSLHQDLYEAFANGGHATLLDVIKAVSAHYVQNGKGEGRAIKHPAQDQPAPEKPKPVKPPVVQNDKPLHEQAQDQLKKLRGIGGDHPSQKPQGGPTFGGDDLKNNSAWQAHQKKMQGPPDDSDDDEWSD